ncbi:MAG: NDP-sugar synthase, partial [Pseudomonadota bacterium]
MTTAMILAAGLGTRLGALSQELPKPLLPVVDVPLIRYPIALLVGHGIRDIVINLHHLGQLIEETLGDGESSGARISYSPEARILGTGGGIRHALPRLGSGNEPFVVINGKVVVDLDLDEVLAAHRASGALATLVVRPEPHAERWGAIDAPEGGGLIRGLLRQGSFMFTGIHVLEPSLVARFPDDGQARCIVRDGYVPWLAAGIPLNAYVARGYFMEHSTPGRYLAGNIKVLRGEAQVGAVGAPIGAPGAVGRRGPCPRSWVHPTATIDASATVVPPSWIGAGARIDAGALVGPDVVIGSDACVAAGVAVAGTVVWRGATVRTSVSGAIVTASQVLPMALAE